MSSEIELVDNPDGLSDFKKVDDLYEICTSCNNKMKTYTTFEWFYSFWSTSDNSQLKKCNNSSHNHANIQCISCCQKEECTKYKSFCEKMNELSELVKRNNDGRCRHCRYDFYNNHKEYGICHICYGRFCVNGFYESSRQYQYVFSGDNVIEKFMICRRCWDDSDKKLFNREPIWEPDANANHCQYDNCNNTFGYILGDSLRHHCRGCGIIICSKHCKPSYIAYTNKMENTCPSCFKKANVIYNGNYNNLYKDTDCKYRKI